MNWRGEMFTDTATSAMPSLAQTRSWRHAVRNAHSPSCTMRPSSSATKTKSFGRISPRSGSFQRSSASMPVMRPVAISTCGW